MLFDTGGQHFLKQWVENLRAGQPLRAFTDEHRSPAYAGDAAHGLLMLLELGAREFYHLGGPEPLSRFDMATRIARAFGIDERLVQPDRCVGLKSLLRRMPEARLIQHGATPREIGAKSLAAP